MSKKNQEPRPARSPRSPAVEIGAEPGDVGRRVYNIQGWGGGYFDVDQDGNMVVMPSQRPEESIRVIDVVREARESGLDLPLQIRFQDLLCHRVVSLNEAFRQAINLHDYQGRYMGVFPVKVNQLREVVEEIIDAGRPYNFGLEAGSKPELLAALSLHRDPEALIVCNGYKDEEFIRHALAGRLLGKKVVIVAEKMEEILRIIKLSRQLKVEPLIGIRIRLSARGTGQWASSGGSSAKFGLTTTEILEAIKLLDQAGLRGALKLLHFHIGSQIQDIQTVSRAVREGARYYAKLVRSGLALEYIDVGGGLGVDYDGSASQSDSSINYSLQEYANDVVASIQEICDEEAVPHPNVISESGRALVAHHALIVVEVFGKIEKGGAARPEITGEGDKLVRRMLEIRERLNDDTLMECYHELHSIQERAQSMFLFGLVDLDVKASIESIYWEIAATIILMYQDQDYVPAEIQALRTELSEQYLCNFSVFQSLPDYWAVGQLFPIVPIHRLNEAPGRAATIADVTCDSDGKVSRFIDLGESRETLPLHDPGDQPYLLGLFMTGAYQDVMGDLHNLFGRVNEVHVYLEPDEESGWYIEEKIKGSSIIEVLAMNQYDRNQLIKGLKKQVDRAIKQDVIKPSHGIRLLGDYEAALKGYTYMNTEQKF